MGCVSGDCEIVTPDDGGFGVVDVRGLRGGRWRRLHRRARPTAIPRSTTARLDQHLHRRSRPTAATAASPTPPRAEHALRPQRVLPERQRAARGLCAPIDQPGDACDPSQSRPAAAGYCLTTNFVDGGQISPSARHAAEARRPLRPGTTLGCGDQATCSDIRRRLPIRARSGELCDAKRNVQACFANLSCAPARTAATCARRSRSKASRAAAMAARRSWSAQRSTTAEACAFAEGDRPVVRHERLHHLRRWLLRAAPRCRHRLPAAHSARPAVRPQPAPARASARTQCSNFWNGSDGSYLCVGWCQRKHDMLTADLLRARRRGDEVRPLWVDAESPAEQARAQALVTLFQAHVGRRAARSMTPSPTSSARTPTTCSTAGWRSCSLTGASSRPRSAVDPMELRRRVFEHARAHHPVAQHAGDPLHPTTRAQVLADVAAELKLDA